MQRKEHELSISSKQDRPKSAASGRSSRAGSAAGSASTTSTPRRRLPKGPNAQGVVMRASDTSGYARVLSHVNKVRLTILYLNTLR